MKHYKRLVSKVPWLPVLRAWVISVTVNIIFWWCVTALLQEVWK